MISKETIAELIERIKAATNLTQEQIADRIGYERPYLSQAKKSDSEKLKKVLLNEFKKELENLTNKISPNDKLIASLEREIKNLETTIEHERIQSINLQKQYEEKIKKIEFNLETVLENQKRLKVELAVAFRLVVQQIVGPENEDKIESVSNEFDTLLTAALH